MRREMIETSHGFFEVWPCVLWPLRFGRWLSSTRRRLTCRAFGHRWRAPHMNPLLGEFRTCTRCWTNEKVGPYPEVRIEAGSMFAEWPPHPGPMGSE